MANASSRWVCLFLVVTVGKFLIVSCLPLPLNSEAQALQKEFPEKCYEGLGCFQTGPPFYDPPVRPVSLLPFDLEHLNTTFLLFTNDNPKNPLAFPFDDESLPLASFNASLDTKIIIHGYSTSLTENDSIYVMKDALLQNGNNNVIIVNWTKSNQPPYAQAVANARVVAAQIAQLINKLKLSLKLQPSSVHLIGHSLGAHLAGWTGKRINGLGRITGLDPAGPYFLTADPLARLDADDADFVDVIHTNGGSNYIQGLGMYEAIGDINFYPNGGRQQPGCENLSPTGSFPHDYDPYQNGCSHQRAVGLFTSSIQNGTCQFWGLSCSDYQDFTTGNCNRRSSGKRSGNSQHVKIQMGYYAAKPRFSMKGGKFYLSTNASPPFCTQ